MFRAVSNSWLETMLLAAAMLASPCATMAQHGGGGGRIGGSSAGGGGLSGGNRATGIENKDDLRDFHQIMAVQASNEQKAAYAAMLKSTTAASADLQGFIGVLAKENNAPEVAKRDKSFEDAIETARTLNKRFLEGFSEAQKSGLKEITKRLGKADSELAQQAKVLDQQVEVNSPGAQMAGTAHNLQGALTGFQREQADLGEEMSIVTSSQSSDVAFKLPTVKNTVSFANQPVVVTLSTAISKAAVEGSVNTFEMELAADLSDLQQTIADVLRARLDTSDRCGEQIALQTATLTPQESTGLVMAQLHYERWSCTTMFGRENMNEIVEGSGTIEVKLTPIIAENGTLQLAAQTLRVDAQGLVGDLLRSATLGETLRDKISDSVLTALRQGADFKMALPVETRSYATLRRARFQGMGLGKLIAVFDGDIQVSNQSLGAVTRALQERSMQSAEGSTDRPQLMAR